jgi:hypothetical protein
MIKQINIKKNIQAIKERKHIIINKLIYLYPINFACILC